VAQETKPFIVHVIPKEPTEEMTVGDFLLSTFSLAGALVVLSLVLAALFAILLVRWNRRHPPELDHPPSINPDTSGDRPIG
jgi:ABC-type phosphate transport system permease subunit